jgi:hypothetical protein
MSITKNMLMRIEYIAGRCKFSAQSLTTTGLYAHFYLNWNKALEKGGSLEKALANE